MAMALSLKGITNVDGNVTMYLDTGITASDIGKPVAIKAATNNTVQLATTGNRIFGRLMTVESRVQEGILVGTIETDGFFEFPVLADDTLAVGGSVVGGASATVKAGTDNNNFVVELTGTSPNKKAIVKLC